MNINQSEYFTSLLKEIDSYIELAATKDHDKKTSNDYKVNLERIKELVILSADIIEILSIKTKGGKEAKFVTNLVRLAVEHWQPGDISNKQK